MVSDTYVLGIDQSTQGTKALLFDASGKLVSLKSLPHKQIINDKGYVEHDLNEIYQNVIAVVKAVVADCKEAFNKIATVGISVQRETVAAFSRTTQKPLYNAIVWQCSRGATYINQDHVKACADKVRTITGLELSEYFSASKFTWLIDNVRAVKEAFANHDLCLSNIDGYLISKLTHGKSFLTEPSNASRTMLMDLNTLQWSSSLCDLFKVPEEALPEIVDSDNLFGYTDFEGVLGKEIPIFAAIGDSQGALFGHGCLSKGQVKTTYGTGSSIMMNSGDTVSSCLHGVVNSVGWRRGGNTTYVLEGNINYSAGIISYLKDDLQLIESAKETQELALAANPNDTCYFVPALSGLGAPYFNSKVRGSIFGMSRLTTKKEIVRAALDSIAYQVTDVLNLIAKSAGSNITTLNVDGGATKNEYLMQTQADFAKVPLKLPSQNELSGVGAALMAGIKAKVYTEEIFKLEKIASEYKPRMSQEECQRKLDGWHKAVKAAIEFGL